MLTWIRCPASPSFNNASPSARETRGHFSPWCQHSSKAAATGKMR